MHKINALSDEYIYLETLSSGLKVAIHPTPNFKKTIVTLQVAFGGIDVQYKIGEKDKVIPSGFAHFLEHMLFSNDGRNIAEEFSKYGANINAYTSKSITNYRFDCIDNFDYLLDYLLRSFISSNSGEQSIVKEKKIIEHELNMSMDSLHHKIYQKLKRMMYSDEAITEDVGGTIKDIKSIDKSMLDEVFNTFYHPKNMSLIISGNVDPLEIISFLKAHPYNMHHWSEFKKITRVKNNLPRKIHSHKKVIDNNNANMISIGIKIPSELFDIYSKDYLHISIGSILSNIFGLASKNFDILKKQNLMNVSFSTNSNIERDYGYINIYMQTDKQEKYYNTILKMIKDINALPLDDVLFEIDKKMILGNFITVFDSLPRIHDFISSCIIENIDIENYLKKVMELKLEDLEPIKKIFVKENIFVVRYLKGLK
ncbi:MAG: insulinase family protein [Tenericutes bacterium]|nr:insulinase family protein [Mycoplasmatota bacterium]